MALISIVIRVMPIVLLLIIIICPKRQKNPMWLQGKETDVTIPSEAEALKLVSESDPFVANVQWSTDESCRILPTPLSYLLDALMPTWNRKAVSSAVLANVPHVVISNAEMDMTDDRKVRQDHSTEEICGTYPHPYLHHFEQPQYSQYQVQHPTSSPRSSLLIPKHSLVPHPTQVWLATGVCPSETESGGSVLAKSLATSKQVANRLSDSTTSTPPLPTPRTVKEGVRDGTVKEEEEKEKGDLKERTLSSPLLHPPVLHPPLLRKWGVGALPCPGDQTGR
mmetsp:Transcript_24191/g.43311  ORF Transcript_24191/g.43311 Transcript_24191/m.43311 type:complete len:280 (-) Transcript_24191:58-897(-)